MVLYRAKLRPIYSDDEYSLNLQGVVVDYESFSVSSETKCGYWIKISFKKKKWVSKTSKKRFAYPTKDEAYKSLKYRTKRRQTILNTQLDIVNLSIKELF